MEGNDFVLQRVRDQRGGERERERERERELLKDEKRAKFVFLISIIVPLL